MACVCLDVALSDGFAEDVLGDGVEEEEEVLDKLEEDHAYLTEGDVFTEDLIETWIDYKRTNEIDPVRFRPTPHEFGLYYDI